MCLKLRRKKIRINDKSQGEVFIDKSIQAKRGREQAEYQQDPTEMKNEAVKWGERRKKGS
jgi:hypothetical protein